MNGLRYVSWTIVVLSISWLFAGALRPLWAPVLRDMPMPAIAREQVSGAFVDAEPALGNAAPTLPGESGVETLRPAVFTLSYDELYPMLSTRDRVSRLDRVDALVRMRSAREDLRPEEVVLTIDDGRQVHRYPLGPHGRLELPSREDWLERDLQVVSNQPPDSLRVAITLMVAQIPSEEIEYRWLAETAEQLEIAMDTLAGGAAARSRQVRGLTFGYRPGQRGEVRVLSRRFGEVYLVDPSGQIRLPLRDELLAENPTVLFSPRPLRMTPLTR